VTPACLTSVPHVGDNERMTDQEITTPKKPHQLRLQSLFLSIAAVAVVLGLLKSLMRIDLVQLLILGVPCSAVIAVLVKSKGTAWKGVVFPAIFPTICLSFDRIDAFVVVFCASLVAWSAGALAASKATKEQSGFLKWSFLFALVWCLIVALPVLVMTAALGGMGHGM
jgi:hypothetical protein